MAIVKRPRTSGNGRGGSSAVGRGNPFATDPNAGTIFDDHRTANGSIAPTSTTSRAGKIDPLALIEALKGDGNIWTRFAGSALENGSLGDGSNEAFLQLLQMMQNNPAVAGTYDDDISKQLYEMMLKLWTTNEQRTYDQSALQEQRNYDSPTNQLARLMGAGISRDAAIQMLQGGQDPALVGSGSESALPEHHSPLEQSLGLANTALSAVSAFTGLVSLGFSVPQALFQADFLRNQGSLLSSQIKAFETAGDAFEILSAAGAGVESIGSVASATSALTKLAKDGNQDAAQFIASGGLRSMRKNAAFVSKAFSALSRSEQDADRYGREYIANVEKIESETKLNNIHNEEVAQEIENAKADYNRILADADFIRANAAAVRALTRKTNKEISVLGKQEKFIEAQTENIGYENQEYAALFGASADGKSYLDWRATAAMDNLIRDARLAAKTKGEPYVQAIFDRMFAEEESVQAAMSLKKLQMDAGAKFSKSHPKEFELYQGLSACGVYDYMEMRIKSKSSAHGGNQIWSGSIDLGTPELDNLSGESWWRKFMNWKPLSTDE